MIDPDQVGEGELNEEQLIYRENILDHYKYPRNKRGIEGAIQHEETNPLCGDRITAYLLVHDGKITDASFQGSGCAISQAAMSMLTERIKGTDAVDVSRISREDIVEMLGIPIGIVRMKCAMLGLRTTQSALQVKK